MIKGLFAALGSSAGFMRRGDIIHLKKKHPLDTQSEEYTHGIIAARIKEAPNNHSEACQPLVKDLIVYLYNPETSKICLDEFGIPVLFSFDVNEVELYKAVKQEHWV
jgi:hypothetical protein